MVQVLHLNFFKKKTIEGMLFSWETVLRDDRVCHYLVQNNSLHDEAYFGLLWKHMLVSCLNTLINQAMKEKIPLLWVFTFLYLPHKQKNYHENQHLYCYHQRLKMSYYFYTIVQSIVSFLNESVFELISWVNESLIKAGTYRHLVALLVSYLFIRDSPKPAQKNCQKNINYPYQNIP